MYSVFVVRIFDYVLAYCTVRDACMYVYEYVDTESNKYAHYTMILLFIQRQKYK